MIACSGATKQRIQIQRLTRTIALEPALVELMRLYDRLGGPSPRVAEQIEGEIERSLGEPGLGRERVQAHLQQLLRARDLHHYVCEDAELAPLKLRLCEHLLYYRSAGERWAAVRELLLEQLDRICETPLPGLVANLELYKRHLSDRGSRLGKLLLTVALFNLDLEGEAPPPNLLLHFRRGRFPHHWWEICTLSGRTTHLATVESWTPDSPLCRWEYLAADLSYALYRRAASSTRGPAAPAPAAAPPADRVDGREVSETIHCRFDADTGGEGPAQMELFPLDTGVLLAGLLRRIQRRHGPEGPRLLAVLCDRLAGAAVGPGPTVLELNLPELATAAGLADRSARALRGRVQRLERIAADLQQVELMRLAPAGQGSRGRTARLLTVLGRSGGWSGAQAAREDWEHTALHVAVDPCLTTALGPVFRALPAALLECAGKAHPYALPLYVWLRRMWSACTDEQAPPVVERTAQSLITEAGLWVSETGRYRALEALKRDLEHLREQGWLGAWRMQRSTQRDAMEDRYRLCAPGAVVPAEPVRAAPSTARPVPVVCTGT